MRVRWRRLLSLLILSGLLSPHLIQAQTTPLSEEDALRYIASHSDLINAFGADVVKGRDHYERWGTAEGRQITFEPLLYIASYSDLIEAFGADLAAGARHYIQYGYAEGRVVTFESLPYIASYQDLIEALGADETAGARHYIEYGYREGREVTFEPLRYIASYGDLIEAFGPDAAAGVRHYIQYGYAEGRRTSFTESDALNYLASYGDLITAFGADVISGLRHYVSYGYREGRRVLFDALAYIASHADLIEAFGVDAMAGAKHYIKFGYQEGRRIIFDALGYLAAHADIRQAFGNDTTAATQHYIKWGFQEGRTYPFTVSVVVTGNGTASTDQLFVDSGETGSVSFVASAGHYLHAVSGCGGALNNTTFTTSPITVSCRITAEFRLDQRVSVSGAVYERLDTEAYPAEFSPVRGLDNATLRLRSTVVNLPTDGIFEVKVDPDPKTIDDDLAIERAGFAIGSWPWNDAANGTSQAFGLYRAVIPQSRPGFITGIVPHDVGGLYMDVYREGLFAPTMQRGREKAGANLVTLVDTILVTELDVLSGKVGMRGSQPWPDQVYPNNSATEIYTSLVNDARSKNLGVMMMITIYPDGNIVDKYFSKNGIQLVNKEQVDFWAAWFSTYKPLVLERAVLARDLEIEYLVLGLNEGFVHSSAPFALMQDLITSIRSMGYIGKIGTFGGSFDNRQFVYDEGDMFEFNRLYDFLGLTFYAVVQAKSGEILPRQQSRRRMRDDIRSRLERHTQFAQPLMVMMGTPSVFGGASSNEYIEPCIPCGSLAPARTRDLQQQADAYQAMYEVINESPSNIGRVMGLLTWGYHYLDDPTRLVPTEDGTSQSYDKSGSVRGKPAEAVMKHWSEAFAR